MRAKRLNRTIGLAFVLVGLVLVAVGPSESGRVAGVLLAAGGLIVVAVGFLIELSFRDERDRERDERARGFFERHGRWPRPGERWPR